MKILIGDSLAEEGVGILREEKEFQVDIKTGLTPEELSKIISDYDALIVRSATKVTKEVIENAKNLKVIGRAGVGLDNVDLESATQKGVIVMNTPSGNTISTAEHTMSLILALSRNIPQADASVKKGEWQRSKFLGIELYDKILGIIGLGRIGTEVAKRALSFGMRVISYDPFIVKEFAQNLGIRLVELEELLKTSDYISVHIPLTETTYHIISKKEFSLMKKGVRVINSARGGILDESALIAALREGKVAGCALDVFEEEPPTKSELLEFSNVVLTPHLGASTEEAQVNVAIEIAESVRDALLGRGVRNAANFPSVEPEVYKILSPYINLVEKLGQLSSQLIEGRIEEVKILYSGEVAKLPHKPLTLSCVKGILSPILKDTVNFINALSLAKERQIKIQEIKTTEETEFVTLVTLNIKSDKEEKKIAGTLFANNQPRIVKIDNFYVEAIPYGYMVIIQNWDRPGIIGNLGTILGKNNINIAGMTFGRESLGGGAITVLNVDSPVSLPVLEQIKNSPHILSVKLISL